MGLRMVVSFVMIFCKCNKYEVFWVGFVVRLFNEFCIDCKEKFLLCIVGLFFYVLMIVFLKVIDCVFSVLRFDYLWIIFRLM